MSVSFLRACREICSLNVMRLQNLACMKIAIHCSKFRLTEIIFRKPIVFAIAGSGDRVTNVGRMLDLGESGSDFEDSWGKNSNRLVTG